METKGNINNANNIKGNQEKQKTSKGIEKNIEKLLPAVEASMHKVMGVKIDELNKDITEKLSKGSIIGLHIDTNLDFKKAKKKFKEEYLKKLLTTNYGNVSLVSRLARVDRRSIHRLLSKSKKDLTKIRDEMLKKDYVKKMDIGDEITEVLESYKGIIHPEKMKEVYANLEKVSEDVASVIEEEPLTLKEAEDEFEKEYLTQALKENSNDVKETAKRIKIRYETLHRKLKKLSLI